mgnify:CR=1 FL=1
MPSTACWSTQASKARKYRTLSEEIAALEARLGAARWRGAVVETKEARAALDGDVLLLHLDGLADVVIFGQVGYNPPALSVYFSIESESSTGFSLR